MGWLETIKPEDLPGDLQLVASECGVDLAINLAEKMGGSKIYVNPLESVLAAKKKEFVLKNFTGDNVKQLAVATRYTEQSIYRILRGQHGQKCK